ncbi:MAG: glycosyltransferase [Methylococcaceae bacterium]|jgi:glycosyltransferase involved in cell wall biosynthesis
MQERMPKLLVYSSLFPSNVRPNAGVFIKERMFRVAQHLPIVVVSPVPWFPFQNLLRYWKPNFRPQPVSYAVMENIKIYYPRFFSIPGFLKSFDGFFMAVASVYTLYKIKKEHKFNIIDAHFAYPDGYAASLLGRWFNVAVTITLRGTEVPLSKMPGRKRCILSALKHADKVFAVANALKQHVVGLGADAEKIQVVGNGVDSDIFYALDKTQARAFFNVPLDAKVLVSVGGLVLRKGFHRVLEVLPVLLKEYPNLIYLIVGGDSPEGNIKASLLQQVNDLGLDEHVRFLGALPAGKLKLPLSAADAFVLATANEGWANVFLEAMACGLPVVTTDVGGNKEVICNEKLGIIVPFGDSAALSKAILKTLGSHWNKQEIIGYAESNSWDKRVQVLVEEFNGLVS